MAIIINMPQYKTYFYKDGEIKSFEAVLFTQTWAEICNVRDCESITTWYKPGDFYYSGMYLSAECEWKHIAVEDLNKDFKMKLMLLGVTL
jgi:hypothetical protein